MATPQPMKHAPSQQGRTPAAATPGASASTPYSNLHAAFSPHGPRSSPQQIKKSPANATAAAMMVSNSQQSGAGAAPMNFDSPSAAAFNSMLGNMAGFDASLDNMGMAGIALPRPSGDEERQKRLDEAIQILSQKKGIVSEEGLERLAKRLGLDILWEDRNQLKILMIAGTTFTVEVGMKDHIVQTVELQFAFSGAEVTKQKSKAEAILLENLKLGPTQHPWTKQLDEFAENLQRLAVLDKLNVMGERDPALVTYDALSGIYESLQRLHEWDLRKLREDPNFSQKPEEHLQVIAMSERNGRPLIHEKGLVGMSLEYWRDQRFHIPSPSRDEEWYKSGKHWGILVSCARRDPMVYPNPVRVSDKWLADEIEMPSTEGLPAMLNWQEPLNIELPEKPDEALLLPGAKYPEVMFTAVMNPPVTLPSSVWEQIHHFTGAPVVPPSYMNTFDFLIFPAEADYNPTEPRLITAKKMVRAKTKEGVSIEKVHENRLFIHKPIYGQTLTELPFSHPSQLVNMLPILRQYAFLWNLLDKAFGDQGQNARDPLLEDKKGTMATVTAISKDFGSFLNRPDNLVNVSQREQEEAVRIDVTLNAHPQPNPKLLVMFPFRGRPAQATIEIGTNGVVQIESTNIVNDEGQVLDEHGNAMEGALFTKHRLGRLLMLFENIGHWCEWIRTHVGP